MYRPAGYFSESYGKDINLIQHREHWILVALLFVFFAVVVLFAGNYPLGIINLILISIISILGLQILTGFAGQISVGHAALMAVGAYSSAILSTKGIPVPISVILASLLTGGLGFLIGWPSIRIKGFYLLMTTFAAQIIIIWAIKNPLASITRGPLGHPAPSPQLFGYVLSGERAWFVCLSLILCVATIVALNLKRSKAGRALIAIRDNDLAAEVMGINLRNYKLFAFFVACIYAGLAGALYAHWQNSAVPEGYDLMKSIWYLGYLVVGGAGSIVGCYLGTIFFILLEEILMLVFSYLGNLNQSWLATIAPLKSIIFGGIIAVFLIYEPRGLASRWEIIKSYYRTWPFPYVRGN